MNRILMRLIVPALLPLLAVSVSGNAPSSWQSRGVGAGGALYSPSINPANDSEYYVASDMSGLYRTTDFGNSYSTINSIQVQGGHESAVRFTGNPLVAYTITYTGGNNAQPAKTTDGGTTWTVLSGNPLPGDDVYSMWVDYDNPGRVIVAGYSDIYFSSNGGASFSPVNVTINTANGALICGAFFDGNNIYLGTNAGMLVSTNGGASFANVGTPGIPAGELMLSFTGAKVGGQMRFFCLTAESAYPGIDLGSDYYQNFRGIYSLENGSGNWTPKTTGLNVNTDYLLSVAMARNDLNTVYAGGGSSAGVPVIFKTTNAGGLWANTFLTGNNQNINTGWSGTGGDRGWGYGEVVFGLAVAPNNSAKALFTDYGFIHRTSNGGTTWQQAYVSPADQHPVNTTSIAGASYHSIGLEDTTVWQVCWTSAAHLFAGFSDIKGIRSTDGGATWTLGYTGHNANSMYRITQHPVSHALYAATSDIHDMYQSTRLADSPLNNADANGKIIVSTTEGASWQTVHNFGHPVFWLSLDPTNTNRMYASVVHSTAGGVFVTSDLQNGAASTWTKLPNPPRTEGHPACLNVLNDGKVVATYSGRRASAFTASSGVFVYDPGTLAWTDVSAAGMLYWTKDLVVDPSDPAQNTWYVGVFSGWGGAPNGLGGLYLTVDRGAHWTRINSLDRVTSVTFSPTNANEAYLTTETDGLWFSSNVHAGSPVFTRVASYPFRQPERVFFNPYDASEIWVTSFGDGLMVGSLGAAPTFSSHPLSQAVAAGAFVTFNAAATGSGSVTYQWRKDGVNLGGATGSSYTIASVTPADAGTYTVVATNSAGSTTSNGANLTVNTMPVISSQPASQSAGVGFPVAFAVTASGTPAPTYQWRKNGTDIAGAVGASYSIGSVVPGDAGTYSVVVTNAVGAVTSTGAGLTVVPFSPASATASDFNGDGKPDILWESSTGGEHGLWLMNGTAITGWVDLYTVAPSWHVAGIADFNGDGKPDILWENSVGGEHGLWLMNGTSITAWIDLYTVAPPWHVAAVADFNGDGKPDILWENSVGGEHGLWLMNGISITAWIDLYTVAPPWHAVAVADFNGDGKPDILWENSVGGEHGLWLMNGINITTWVDLYTVAPPWHVAGVADFNGDGKPDILWENSMGGEHGLWLMNGINITGWVDLYTVHPPWHVAR